LPLNDTNLLAIDMSDVTYINSIGVKNWILWTLRIPKACDVKLINCPVVIVSQASMVHGFTTPRMTIESFRMPYACDTCGFEDMRFVSRGAHYEYATETHPKRITLPADLPCPKCGKGSFLPDVVLQKVFKFLG
ncbi:MAG: hypothetical protein AB7P49_19960, partial [Bdellovibrionales bacterium]